MSMTVIDNEQLGDLVHGVDEAIAELGDRLAVPRLWDRDYTLWQEDPTEVADRLGWLSAAVEDPSEHIADFEALAAEAWADGLRRVVLLGMGGSSLFPEVLWRSFGARDDRFPLTVLDTTHPGTIGRLGSGAALDDCLFLAASKSGTTIETTSQLAHFWDATGGDPKRFVVITDPGSDLARLGVSRGFRRVIENRADIGGRYSALSAFGLVPGALLGVDVGALMGRARSMAQATSTELPTSENPAVRLAALMVAGVRSGRDKLTLVLSDDISTFGLWVEQLVAESTGKHGSGVVPIVDEPLGEPNVYGNDRVFVAVGDGPHTLRLAALVKAGHPVIELAHRDALDLGGQVLLWEEATALAGALLGLNPFDQPDVASAKAATNKVLEERSASEIDEVPLSSLVESLRPGDYLALQAFVDLGDSSVMAELQRARLVLRDRCQVATTLGIGPRFLHSTGQLHKGGPATGVFVQVVDGDLPALRVPDKPYSFATLLQAQAAGDLATLADRGMRVGRVRLAELSALGTVAP
ncbi:MAG: glucose-6-phosphate isomerase [Actinobacteria bacterium]|nr:glucose-6-phosphate isomerase [Actinomycetota bacterium]